MGLVALPEGQRGEALFSQDGTRRLWLARSWGAYSGGFVLWVGMNPSLAGSGHNDPTVTRIVGFTRDRLRRDRCEIVNIADYVATEPADLAKLGIAPTSDGNLPLIVKKARAADMVVMCQGDVPRVIRGLSRHTVTILRDLGIPMYCLGTTKKLDPKHPLYLSATAPFSEYTETPNAL